jgi:hypothetical protein
MIGSGMFLDIIESFLGYPVKGNHNLRWQFSLALDIHGNGDARPAGQGIALLEQ